MSSSLLFSSFLRVCCSSAKVYLIKPLSIYRPIYLSIYHLVHAVSNRICAALQRSLAHNVYLSLSLELYSKRVMDCLNVVLCFCGGMLMLVSFENVIHVHQHGMVIESKGIWRVDQPWNKNPSCIDHRLVGSSNMLVGIHFTRV
jgi:hypothetical protein